jgi:hypothetical protein
VPGRCVVFLVFLDVLAPRQDSRPLYCVLAVPCCNEVVAFFFSVPAFVTRSHLTMGHLTLFPVFNRPFGLPLLNILLYLYLYS